MAWDGYATFAGVEIYNRARTQRYMKDAAPGVLHDCDCDCGDLHEVVGDRPYSNPALDDAPWYDPDVAGSTEFFGLLPLSVTGLDDSTRTATVTEFLGPGGAVSGRRKATREVRVRGLLLASTDRGVQYGQDWLSSVLEGACASCDGDTFCFFASCPDPDRVPRRKVSNVIDPLLMATDGGNWDGEVFTSPAGRARLFTPRLVPPVPCVVTYEWTVQGPAGAEVWLHAGGEADTPYDKAQRFVLDGNVQRLVVDDRGWSRQWVSSWLSASDPDGPEPEKPSHDVLVHRVRVTHTVDHEDPYTAATDYLRQIREVTALEGPRLIQEHSRHNFHMREVDFTLGAMVPYVFSQEVPIAALHSGRPMTTLSGTIQKVSVGVDDCPEEGRRNGNIFHLPSLGPYGIVDPDIPRVPPPPILDPLVAGRNVTRPEDNYIVTIPDAALPTWTDMLPTIRLGTAHLPVRNVRVRFFPATMEGMDHTHLSGCDACGSFVITYIPPNSEITLDGTTQKATVRYNGTMEDHPASHLLASDGGNVFTWPVLSCGMGYFAAVDLDFVTLPVMSLALVARRG